jgi:hypothetical protein
MAAREMNAHYFGFLRARQMFVMDRSAKENIEGFVVWGAAVDALCRIHAGRLGATKKGNRRCFIRGLLDLAQPHRLERTAIPLLHHDLQLAVPAAAKHSAFAAYRAAANHSRIWSATDDLGLTREVASLSSSFPPAAPSIRANSYAAILYEEYRCCAVHGLDLGRKTCNPFDPRPEPHYMNYVYGKEDPRPAVHRYRTRIVFPLAYLGVLLDEMIASEEAACVTAKWLIPPYPTLVDDESRARKGASPHRHRRRP